MIAIYRRAAATLERVPEFPMLLARLTLGVLFIDHGLQKYNAKGGLTAFEGFLRFLKNIPAPALMSQVVPALEVIGGVALIAGVLTRVFALLLAIEMFATAFLVKANDLHQPLVSKAGAGVELDLLYLVLLVAVLLLGPGRASIDRLLGLEGERMEDSDIRATARTPQLR